MSTISDEDVRFLLARAPPADLEKNLAFLRQRLQDNPDVSAALNSKRKYLIPFKVVDMQGGKPFLACNYNRVEAGYRSPWTNVIHTMKESGSTTAPAEESIRVLRPLETTLNEVWDAYKNLYYGYTAVGSVFLTEKEGSAFEGLFGIQKQCSSGSWNSVSLVVAGNPTPDGECEYDVETQICLVLYPSPEEDTDDVTATQQRATVSSLVSKTTSRTFKVGASNLPIDVSHIENVGTIIEANEIDLRSNLEKVLIPKNKEMIDNIQKEKTESHRPQVNPLAGMMMNSEVLKRKLAKSSDPHS